MFEYDASMPLNIRVVSTHHAADVTVEDIRYARVGGGKPISAYRVMPQGHGPFPAILYVHWYEPASPLSNRDQFLDEATEMAKKGVVSLLISTHWSDPAWFKTGRSIHTDFGDSVKQVIELRRALDVLEALPQVDRSRMAYVGHDFGAMYGAVLAGVDPRAKAYVLIAGTKDFSDWFLLGTSMTEAEDAAFAEQMAPLAPTTYVAQAAPAYVFFQFGRQDSYVPDEAAAAFFAAASRPKGITRYDTGHAMDLPAIRDVRVGILEWQLGLGERR